MRKIIFGLVALLALVGCSQKSVSPQDAAVASALGVKEIKASENLDEISALSKPVTQNEDEMFAWINAVRAKFERDDVAIYDTVIKVEGNERQSNFGTKLQTAFNKAFLDVRAQYLTFLTQNIATEEARQSSTPEASNAKNIGELASTLSQSDSYVKSVTRKASGMLGGLVPIQTNLVKNKNGVIELGLVAIVSPKTLQIVNDLKSGATASTEGRTCKPLSEWLPANADEAVGMLGIRLVFNEMCEPVVLSYALADLPRNEAQRSRQSAVARQKASLEADSFVANFLSSSVDVDQMKKSEQTVVENLAIGDKDDNAAVKTKSVFASLIRSNSQISLSGVKTLAQFRTASDAEISAFVVVRAYSSSQIQNALGFGSDFYKEREANRPVPGKAYSKKSRNDLDPEDF